MMSGMSGAQTNDQAQLPSGLAALLGGGGVNGPGTVGQGQGDKSLSTSVYIWKVVHAVFAFTLGIYMIAVTTFNGTHFSRAGIAHGSAEGEVGKRLFWVFTTMEMVLQGSRFVLEEGNTNQSGWVGMLIQMLPEPWKSYVGLLARYSGIWTTIAEDAMIVVFVLGCVAWWKGAIS